MKNWKSIVYLACLIQVGAGISMVGVMSFLPLFYRKSESQIPERRLSGQG